MPLCVTIPNESPKNGSDESDPGRGLRELVFKRQTRKHVRTKITKKFNMLSALTTKLSVTSVKAELTLIKELKIKIESLNESISKLVWSEHGEGEIFVEELESCDPYEETVIKMIKLLENMELEDASLVNNSNQQPLIKEAFRVSNQLKLPQLPLPEYSRAEGQNLELFFNNFEAIINKYALSEYEKFVFLRKQVSCEPLKLMDSLQGSQQTYGEAKSLLRQAFADPLTTKFDLIKRLTRLKLDFPGDPFSWIGEMRIIIKSFEDMEINVETILQYFVWTGLNISFQNQLISIMLTDLLLSRLQITYLQPRKDTREW